MPGPTAALALLLLNFGLLAAVHLFSPTTSARANAPPATDRCFVCAAPDPETTVGEYPVCSGCSGEYFESV